MNDADAVERERYVTRKVLWDWKGVEKLSMPDLDELVKRIAAALSDSRPSDEGEPERLEEIKARRESARQLTAEKGFLAAPVPTWADVDYLLSLLAAPPDLRRFYERAELHPEDYCHRCNGPNFSWYAPSLLWNQYVRDKGEPEIICPICFAELAKEANVTWSIVPERVTSDYDERLAIRAAQRIINAPIQSEEEARVIVRDVLAQSAAALSDERREKIQRNLPKWDESLVDERDQGSVEAADSKESCERCGGSGLQASKPAADLGG